MLALDAVSNPERDIASAGIKRQGSRPLLFVFKNAFGPAREHLLQLLGDRQIGRHEISRNTRLNGLRPRIRRRLRRLTAAAFAELLSLSRHAIAQEASRENQGDRSARKSRKRPRRRHRTCPFQTGTRSELLAVLIIATLQNLLGLN